MRFLTLAETIELHQRIVDSSGGASGIRDMGALQSALAQPRASFAGEDLYPTLVAKAAALCFSLVGNHPFVDGNKRIAHAATEVFLMLNGFEIDSGVDEQEKVMLSLAAGAMSREELLEWLSGHVREVLSPC